MFPGTCIIYFLDDIEIVIKENRIITKEEFTILKKYNLLINK